MSAAWHALSLDAVISQSAAASVDVPKVRDNGVAVLGSAPAVAGQLTRALRQAS